MGYSEKKILRKSDEALAQTAQGGGGVTVPGGVQKESRCGTEGHGYWHGRDRLTAHLHCRPLLETCTMK